MARGKKEDVEAELLATRLEEWALKHDLAADTYVAGLASALRERQNLPLWAEINPLDYLPRPEVSADRKIATFTRRLSILRGVLLFSPVALTWLAGAKRLGDSPRCTPRIPETLRPQRATLKRRGRRGGRRGVWIGDA